MRQKLLDLYEIQKIDLQIRDIEKRKDSISLHLGELSTAIDAIREELSTLTDQREAAQREAKGLEALVRAESDKIRKWEKRLNDIRNQREYLALSREVEGSKRSNRDNEDKILEHMKTGEDLTTRIEELQDRLAESEVDREEERTKVDAQIATTEAEVEVGMKRRETLLPSLPSNILRKYDSIRAKRVGVGLIQATDGSCQGCFMKLPPQLYNIIQRGDTIEQCPSCLRIIVWGGFIEAPEAPATSEEASV